MFVVIASAVTSCAFNTYDYKDKSYIFESISDLDFLNEYQKDEIEDKSLKNEKIVDSKNISMTYENKVFNFHAYIFESLDDTISYASRVTGNKYEALVKDNELSMYYYYSKSFLGLGTTSQTLIFSNDKAYYFNSSCSSSVYSSFTEFYMSNLIIKVEFSY